MKFPVQFLIGLVISITMTAITPQLMANQNLSEPQIDTIASQTTVVIAQGLQKGDIEARQEWNPGSGVVIAHDGNIYYVLTALHVVRTRDVVYGIRTSDGEVHFVDDVNTKENIRPFGAEDENLGETIEGFDLALVKFQSKNNYPVAVVGKSSQIQSHDPVYVSGWPNPEDETAKRERELSAGQLNAIVLPPSPDGGYSLLYNNQTRRGMSGGPVFNGQGELVGIHGRGRAQEDEYCIDPQLSTQNSCGMQTIHFINEVEKEGLPLSFKPPPVNLEELSGFDRQKADVIENIYDAFSFSDVRSLLRDGPSGGCDSLLLGDPCQ